VKRLLKWLALAVAIIVLGLGGFAAYGIYSAYYGKHIYETTAPELPAHLNGTAVLVFSKTNGYRHSEAIPAANAAFEAIANKHGWSAVFTENGAAFTPAILSRFQTTVWNNTSGDTLNAGQRAAFQGYIENGGGFVGIHSAGGDPHYDWQWYVQKIIGAQFSGHPLSPQFQRAMVHVVDPADPIMAGIPAAWSRVDEWYSFKTSPRATGVQVLATLDENTYSPKLFWKDLRMGADHPVIWKHMVGQGRVFYSALGHLATAYSEPEYDGMLDRAIQWSAGLTGANIGN
jgi:type 1 glutamine amidotransferase